MPGASQRRTKIVNSSVTLMGCSPVWFHIDGFNIIPNNGVISPVIYLQELPLNSFCFISEF
jgi:hypothetical protein